MSELTNNNTQPSQLMQSHVDIEPGTYFFVQDAKLIDDKGHKESCNFEVARDLSSGHIFIICYFDAKTYVSRKLLSPMMSQRLTGIERSTKFEITILNLVHRGGTVNDHSPNLRFTSMGFTLFNKRHIGNPSKLIFDIAGLRLTGPAGGNFWTTNFEVSDNLMLKQTTILGMQDIKYSNQSTSKLEVIDTTINESKAMEIVDIWCNLVFLSFGQNADWTCYEILDANDMLLSKTWRAVKVPFRVAPYGGVIFSSEWVVNDLKKVRRFIEIAIRELLVQPGEILKKYIQLIGNYRYYLAMVNEPRGTTRLITSLTEEFLLIWGENNEPEFFGENHRLITRGERNKVKNELIQHFEKNQKELLTKEHSKANVKSIMNALAEKIGEIGKPSFKDKLYRFFKHYEVELSIQLLNAKGKPVDRITYFVDTRNAILHSGKFATNNHKTENQNALMMIPLMIFAITGYEGEVHDFVFPGQTFHWTKHEQTSDSST